jgi:hypothetical protein
LGELEWSQLFAPSSLELGELAYERREAGFMVLAIDPFSRAIPEEGFSRERRGSQGEGEFEDLCPQ